METIPQEQLRNQVAEVLRRVEVGETSTVTVAGRPVAELRPTHRRRWVSGPALAGVWQGPPPRRLDEDLAHLGAGLSYPFRR
ncbi:type II toxin-antitoxin system Phd/YefM family antitoxin [Geodermatophilus sp. SYSU D01176]